MMSGLQLFTASGREEQGMVVIITNRDSRGTMVDSFMSDKLDLPAIISK